MNTRLLVLRRSVPPLLVIGLFSYAALDKTINATDFQVKLLKATYLPVEVIPYISISIPLLECLAVVFLLFSRTEQTGWRIVYFLMVGFTGHLLLLHKLAPSSPCSCGGMLESLSFGEHLLLNVCVIFLSAARILTHGK